MKNHILPFEINYLDVAADTFIDVFGNEPWNYNWIVRDNIIRYFTDLYNTPGFQGFVLLGDGEITGICFGILNDYFISPYYEIKEIFIKRQYQGLGYGGQLLSFVEKELLKQDVSTIILLTDQNIDAFKFYSKNGYAVSPSSVHMSKNTEK